MPAPGSTATNQSPTTAGAATTTTEPSVSTTTLATTTSVGPGTTSPGGPTTTLPTTTTSSPLLAMTELSSVCINDTPWIEIGFGNQPVYDGMPATISFFDMTGNPADEPIVTTYRARRDGARALPGAAVDPTTGEPTDWPGWRQLPDGRWVEDPTDSLLRDGLRVTVDVNPHAEGLVTYPPATPACDADPPRSSTPGLPAPTTTVLTGILAVTGDDSTLPTTAVATALAGVGLTLLGLARRRRPD